VRTVITLVALVFICAFGFATVYALLETGPNVATGISVVIVALMAFGILGALTER
jgi:hypothetical protein